MSLCLYIYKMQHGNKRVIHLKSLVKEHGLRGYSGMRKYDLIELLRNNLPPAPTPQPRAPAPASQLPP